jgi:integrase
MKLTKTSVEKLEARGTRYSQFDDELKGFAVRVGMSGDKAFYYVYRAGKGRGAALKWLRIGSFPTITVEQARAVAKIKAAAVAMGDDPAQAIKEDKAAPLARDVLSTFFTEHVEAKLKPASRKMYRSLIDKKITPAIGRLKVVDVEHRHIAMLHHSMRETPYWANRAYAVVSKFFSWAETNGYRPRGSNPAIGIEKYKEHKRTAFMGAPELAQLGVALAELEQAWHDREAVKQRKENWDSSTPLISPQVAAIIRLLCLTGARVGEILSLKWEYFDLDAGLAHLPDSKTGAKVLHLPKPAVALLASVPRCSDWVFPGLGVDHVTDIHRSWRIVCEKANFTGWRIHDLRHAFASTAVNSGHSLPQIGALLGHVQTATTQRYAHIAENPVHAVAEDAGAQIAAALAGKPRKATVVALQKAEKNR